MKKIILSAMSVLLLTMIGSVCIAGTAVDKAFNDNIRRGDGKISIGVSIPDFDIPSDAEADLHCVNKFGHAPAGVQATLTDIWDLADATPTSQLWVAPTAARVHALVSGDAGDDGDPAGVGAHIVRVYGLLDWDTPEVFEDVILNGTGAVNTTNSYVIIHRMKVIKKGATSINVGAITATAASDATVTAVILAGTGSTEMALYGICSLQKAYMTHYYAGINKAGGAVATIDYAVRVNSTPDTELINFRLLNSLGVQSTGSSHFDHPFNPYLKIEGPAIIKLQGLGSAADLDGTAGFDLIIKTDTSGFDAILTTASNRKLDSRIITTADGRIIRTAQNN